MYLFRNLLVILAFSSFQIMAEEEVNCDKQLHEQRQVCYKYHHQDNQDQTARSEKLANEMTRHNTALQNCKSKWGLYRDQMHNKYLKQNAQCTTAACRLNSLNGYNLLFNIASMMEQNCVQAEHSTHSDYVNRIYAEYPEIDYDSNNPAYDNLKECKQKAQDDYNICKEQNSEGGNSEGSYQTKVCPPGTQPNVLGLCVKNFSMMHFADSSTDNDGCGPGSVRGHDDGCKPQISAIGFFHDGSTWWMMCPKGTKPSPIDGGCVLAPDPTTADSQDNDPVPLCPPGTSPGSDDGCVPDIVLDMGITSSSLMLPSNISTPYLGVETYYDGLSQYAMPVEDPETAIEVTRQALDAEDYPY